MKRLDLIAYSESFVSFILESEIAKNINKVILFDSVARGDFDSESDIDIFIDTDKNIEEELERERKAFESSKIREEWELKGIENEISLKTGKLEKWDLRRDVISSGIILYGKYEEIPELDYYLMIEPDYSGLERKDKKSVWRKLYGYEQKVGEKKYSFQGLLNKLGGKRIGKTLIVPMEERNKILEFLRNNDISFKVYEVWSDML